MPPAASSASNLKRVSRWGRVLSRGPFRRVTVNPGQGVPTWHGASAQALGAHRPGGAGVSVLQPSARESLDTDPARPAGLGASVVPVLRPAQAAPGQSPRLRAESS